MLTVLRGGARGRSATVIVVISMILAKGQAWRLAATVVGDRPDGEDAMFGTIGSAQIGGVPQSRTPPRSSTPVVACGGVHHDAVSLRQLDWTRLRTIWSLSHDVAPPWVRDAECS